MKIRNYLASLILVLWFNATHSAATGTLGDLVRAYRDSPTPARRTAVTSYAASHPKEAPLAALALGITAYEQRDYPSAIALLPPVVAQLPAVADYAAYYLAAARVEANDLDRLSATLAPARRETPASPFALRSWI